MKKKTGSAACLVACLVGLTLAAPAALAAGCGNEALREAQGVMALPGCRALEMVSPPRKFSQPAFLPVFSRDGERVLIKVQAPLAGTPGYQHFGGDAYVAGRATSGWSIAPTAPPDRAILGGGPRFGNPATFAPDLSRWTQLGSTEAEYAVGVTRLFGGGLDGSFEQRSPLLVPIDDTGPAVLSVLVGNLEVDGSSADLAATVLRPASPSTAYLPADPRGGTAAPGSARNSYVASIDENGEPDLQLLARDKEDVVYGGLCGAHLGGGENATFNQGVISSDGSRIYFSTRPAQPWDPEEGEEPPCDTGNGLRVFRRTASPEGPVIEEIAPGDPAGNGDDLFQAASVDGSRVYFTSPRKLTGSDIDAAADPCSAALGASKGCDLYLHDTGRPEGEQLVQVSAGDGPGPADVLSSVAAVSGDGSRAYFVAQGVLTADTNPEGDGAVAGAANLYLYEAQIEQLSFVATLSPEDQGGIWGTKGTRFGDAYATPVYGPGLAGGGAGHVLAFASKASVTADDLDGGFRDVFCYDALAETLERVSKAAPGGQDNGPFDAAANPAVAKVVEYNFGEATRWASEDGQVVGFATAEPLVPGDTDGETNPYVWDGGEIGAVLASVTEPPAVAPVGGQVAFSTDTQLLPSDVDTAQDVYVARPDGGFLEPVPLPICDPLQEGSCQGPPDVGPGAVPSSVAGVNVKPPGKCRKGQVRRMGRCVKKPRKGKVGKQAGRNRGGSR